MERRNRLKRVAILVEIGALLYITGVLMIAGLEDELDIDLHMNRWYTARLVAGTVVLWITDRIRIKLKT